MFLVENILKNRYLGIIKPYLDFPATLQWLETRGEHFRFGPVLDQNN